MVVTKVVDSGPFHFYGNLLLKKTPVGAAVNYPGTGLTARLAIADKI